MTQSISIYGNHPYFYFSRWRCAPNLEKTDALSDPNLPYKQTILTANWFLFLFFSCTWLRIPLRKAIYGLPRNAMIWCYNMVYGRLNIGSSAQWLSRQGLLGVIMIRPCSYQFILEDVLFCCCMLMISNWLVITPLPYFNADQVSPSSIICYEVADAP